MIMMDMAPKHGLLDCEAVLAEMGWLASLARGLGADPHAAEDLTQATFLTALEHPPETDRPVKGWLATVLRNLFNEGKRRRLRRAAREGRAARPEADSSGASVLERAAIQKRVVDAVMALDEPYRTTVLLRFFEGLPPRKIAARTGTPVATVKTRLARALEQLRSRLDREHGGDRRAWLFCLLAPLPKAALEASAIGVVIVEAKAKLATATAVLLIGVAGWFAYDRLADDRPAVVVPPGAQQPDGSAPKPAGAGAPEKTGTISPRSFVDPTEAAPLSQPASGMPSPTTVAESAPGGARIRGRVIDTRSAPVAGVRVAFKPAQSKSVPPEKAVAVPPIIATSSPDGIFEMAAPRSGGTLVAESPGHVTVLVGTYDEQAPAIEPLIVVAPLRKVEGRIVDSDRRPLAGAEIAVELPENFRAQFTRILDYSTPAHWTARSDAEGRFAFEAAPDVEGAAISARLAGFEAYEERLPGGSGPELEIVLARTRPRRDTISGQVVDHAGGAVPDARVSTRDRTTRTDARGRFTIKIDEAKPPASIVALKEGFLPAEAKVAGDAPVVLRLDGTPLSIEGKVVDQNKKPLADVQVWTADPTFFASGEEGTQFIENVLSNPKAGRGGAFWAPIKTDADGRFTLRGLMPRDYRIHVMDPKTLALDEAAAIRAGSTDVVIVLPGDDVHATVSGTIVSLGGVPVANAQIRPIRDTFSFQFDDGGRATRHADIKGATTDESGRFTIRGIPKKGVYLRIDAANILPREFGRGVGLEGAAKGQELDKLRIEVAVRCHLQVDLGPQAELANAVSVLDSSGKQVNIDVFFGGTGRRTMDRVEITDGRTAVLAVPENVTTVILLKDMKEVLRKPVKLVPGQVTTVKP